MADSFDVLVAFLASTPPPAPPQSERSRQSREGREGREEREERDGRYSLREANGAVLRLIHEMIHDNLTVFS